ncbi:MAG: trypsin-like peptidase domain-containing protein [Limisphaerales bacterium]
MKPTPFLLVALLGLALLAQPSTASELSAAARKIHAAHEDSVIWISAVAKTSFASEGRDSGRNLPDQENKLEALGTIIDSSGLVVAALSSIDPGRIINARQSSAGNQRVDASSVLKDVKVIMPDGTEIPAEVVMKDTDLDLAFIRIKTDSREARGVTFKAVDLKDSAKGELLDEVVTVARVDEVFNRVSFVATGEINMLTRKPREFLRSGNAVSGCPTFLTNGKLLGITAGRFSKGRGPVPAIIPAADVLEIAEQAKAAKPSEATEPKAEAAAKEGN